MLIILRDKIGTIIGNAIIDDDKKDIICKHKWYISRGYAVSNINGKMTKMHRLLMDAEKYAIIDHKNCNKLDNRICNLEISDKFKNAQNRNISKNKKSSCYMGVQFDKKSKKYYASFKVKNNIINLGWSYDAKLAAILRDRYVAHMLLHVPLNFSDKKEEYLRQECPTTIEKIKDTRLTGVRKNKDGSYVVHVCDNNKNKIYVGKTESIEDALIKYDKYVIDNKIMNRRLNHPERYPDLVSPDGKTLKQFHKYYKIDDNIGYLSVIHRHTVLNVHISNDDYDKIKYYHISINNNGYACFILNGRMKTLHRFICDIDDDYFINGDRVVIDHIDGNKLNNIKHADTKYNNLRLSTPQQNSQNKAKSKNAASKYYGVCKTGERWCGKIVKDTVTVFLWSHSNEEYCARARDLFILTNLVGTHYKLNFSWENDEIARWKCIVDIDRKKNTKLTSQYIGVFYHRSRWVSVINFENDYGKQSILIKTSDEIACAIKRDQIILKNFLHLKRLKTNFDRTLKTEQIQQNIPKSVKINTMIKFFTESSVNGIINNDNSITYH